MPTHALPHLLPESVGVNDDCIDGNRLYSPVLPRGQVLPDESRSQPDLSHIRARLEAATADLVRLRARLLIALNKGLVLNEMGEIADRFVELCQSLPDQASRPRSRQPDAGVPPACRQADQHP